MLQCQEAAKDLRTRLVEIASERFDAVERRFDGLLDKIDHALTMTGKRRELATYLGGSAQYGKESKQLDKEYSTLQKKLTKLKAEQQAFLDAGGKKGSEKYREMQAAIEGVEEALLDTQIAQSELQKARFDAVGEQYERSLDVQKHEQSMIQSGLDMMKYAGGDEQAQYDRLLSAQSKSIDIQRNKIAALNKSMQQALDSGKIKKGSAAWYEMQAAIHAADEELQQMILDTEQLRVDAFKAVEAENDRVAQRQEHITQMLEGELEGSKFLSGGVGDIYMRMIVAQDDAIDLQKKKYEELKAARDKAMEGPDGIKEGSAEWHEMTAAIEEAEEQLQKSATNIKQLYVDAFDAVQKEFESRISAIEQSVSMAEALIADAQYTNADRGNIYQSMLDENRAKYAEQQAEMAALEQKLAEAVANGVQVGSEEWYKLQSQIDTVATNMQKTQTAIRAVYKEAFDSIEEEYSRRMSTLDHVRKTYENINTASQYNGQVKQFGEMIMAERVRMNELYAERAELQRKMDVAMADATNGIEAGSAAWQDMQQKIDSVDEAIQQASIDISELFVQAFDAIEDEYNNVAGLIGNITSIVENDLSEMEKRGRIGGENMYRQMMSIEESNIEMLRARKDALEDAMQAALDAGAINEYSDAWYKQKSAIDSVEASIRSAELSVIDYANAIRQIRWDVFDRTRDSVSDMTDEAEFLIGLMENSKLFDKSGRITDTGAATAGLLGVKYDVAMAQADAYADEIRAVNAEIAKDPNNTKLIDRRKELLGLQRDAILAAEDEKQAVRSLVEEGFNAELSALQELISAYEESLDQAKDLYDYQKRVSEQTKEIASLQKQMSAYAGDNSEENKARLQRLTVDLSDAQEQLAETQYEHYISDQKKLLDDLYDEYERILNERLDDVDALMRDIIESANANTAQIIGTLTSESAAVGASISSELRSVWTGGAQPALAMYASDIGLKMTGVGTAVSNIEKQVSSIVEMSASDITASTATAATAAQEAAQNAASILEQLGGGSGTTYADRTQDALSDIKTSLTYNYDSNERQNERLEELLESSGRIAEVVSNASQGESQKAADEREATKQALLAAMTASDAAGIQSVIQTIYSAAQAIRESIVACSTAENSVSAITSNALQDAVYHWGDVLRSELTAIRNKVTSISPQFTTTYGTDTHGNPVVTNTIAGFAKGGFIADLQKAAVRNGDDIVTINTLKKGEAVFTEDEFRQIDKLVSAIPGLMNIVDINRFMAPALSGAQMVSGNTGIDVGGVSIQIDHVQDYNDFVRQLRDDKDFERMIGAMTIDRMTGGSSLAKKRYYN